MGKPKPAGAGGSTTPAELLAQAEAALAGLSPEDRAVAEEELDELRQAARADAEAERMQTLAAQEIANHAEVHAVADDAPAEQSPAAEHSEGGE